MMVKNEHVDDRRSYEHYLKIKPEKIHIYLFTHGSYERKKKKKWPAPSSSLGRVLAPV